MNFYVAKSRYIYEPHRSVQWLRDNCKRPVLPKRAPKVKCPGILLSYFFLFRPHQNAAAVVAGTEPTGLCLAAKHLSRYGGYRTTETRNATSQYVR